MYGWLMIICLTVWQTQTAAQKLHHGSGLSPRASFVEEVSLAHCQANESANYVRV